MAFKSRKQRRFRLNNLNISSFLNNSNMSQTKKFFEDEKLDFDNFMSERNKENNQNKSLRKKLSNLSSVTNFMTMTNGSYFGEVEIILRKRRTCMLVAATECDMFFLSRMVSKFF